MFENPRRGRQARNFTTNAPKTLDLKSSSEQIFSRKMPLGAPVTCIDANNNTFNVSYVTRTNTKWIAQKFNAYRINHLLVLTFYWQLVFIIKERFIVYYGNDVWFRW